MGEGIVREVLAAGISLPLPAWSPFWRPSTSSRPGERRLLAVACHQRRQTWMLGTSLSITGQGAAGVTLLPDRRMWRGALDEGLPLPQKARRRRCALTISGGPSPCPSPIRERGSPRIVLKGESEASCERGRPQAPTCLWHNCGRSHSASDRRRASLRFSKRGSHLS